MIKFVRAYTGRTKIISFVNAYHGSTFGSLSLSAISLNMRKKIGPLLPDIYHFEYPTCYRCPFGQEQKSCNMECFKQIERAFTQYLPPEEIAAIVFEPIAGDAGLVVPPKEYVEKLYQLCQKHGILFVSEEVQQGFGRTGKWFGIEHFDIIPDLIVTGKSIASGMPLSALIGRAEIIDSLDAPAHLFTMSGHQVSCQSAIASIKVIEEENLIQNAEIMGQYIQSKFNLLAEKYEMIGEIRGKGLSIGVEIVKNRLTKEKDEVATSKICYRCWEKGLILIFLAGNVLRIQPPLVIKRDEIDQAFVIIESAINDYLRNKIPDSVLEIATGW